METVQQEARNVIFLLMPQPLGHGQHLYLFQPNNGFGLNAQGIGWAGTTPSTSPPYVAISGCAAAHKKAQELSKEHGCAYHIAQVNILGQYVPPPPEWKPTYEDTWAKPGPIKLVDK